jgi:hypothetical protein
MESKALELLREASSEKGFLASSSSISNYKRVWARDGVICSLAVIASKDKKLIATARETLLNLAKYQHEHGNIPSNIYFKGDVAKVSFGGLSPRVDTLSWFIIGVCHYSYFQKDRDFFENLKPNILKAFRLMEIWEYNYKDLMHVPRSGNWADEYPTQGFTLYDQVLRVWALRSFSYLENNPSLVDKENSILNQIQLNFKKSDSDSDLRYHPKAYKSLEKTKYWVASLEPAGYQTQFDAFGNALLLLLGIGKHEDRNELVEYTEGLRNQLKLKLLPAFWPVIKPSDADWVLLEQNCAYEFRNFPYQFHNGGTWQMINSFYGLALLKNKFSELSQNVLKSIQNLNAKAEHSFFENFDSQNGEPNGVPFCAWSAAGEVLLQTNLKYNTLLL